jgi:hypothetical protein
MLMVPITLKSFSMEVGCMNIGAENRRIKTVGKNRFIALGLF